MYIYRALEKRGFNAFAKGFDSDQPAQSAQTDLSRTFFLLVNFDHHSAYLGDRVIYPSVVSRNFYLMPGFFAIVGAVLKDIVYRNNLASVASRLSIERKYSFLHIPFLNRKVYACIHIVLVHIHKLVVTKSNQSVKQS